jgi:hypothetical protein
MKAINHLGRPPDPQAPNLIARGVDPTRRQNCVPSPFNSTNDFEVTACVFRKKSSSHDRLQLLSTMRRAQDVVSTMLRRGAVGRLRVEPRTPGALRWSDLLRVSEGIEGWLYRSGASLDVYGYIQTELIPHRRSFARGRVVGCPMKVISR